MAEIGPDQVKELKATFRIWVGAKFGGDWDRAFRSIANRSNTDNTINREDLLWALEQVGIGNWITRGLWADAFIKATDKSDDGKISDREFVTLFNPEDESAEKSIRKRISRYR